jgi:lipopolysaccharide heptosyltransferase II
LVTRFSAIGDIVLTLPAVQALKRAWPESTVVFATKEPFRCLVESHPAVDRVLTIASGESFSSFRARAHAEGIDAILDLHGKLRSAALRWSSPNARSITWKKRSTWDNISVRAGWRTYDPDSTIIERYHRAVEDLVGSPLPRENLSFEVTDTGLSEAQALLDTLGRDSERPLLGLSPGANWATKQWPTQSYAELAERAVASGYQVIVTASATERHLVETIKTRVPEILDASGSSLESLGGLIGACSTFVANDSGPMHIARALKIPTVAIFGSTAPQQFDFTHHEVLYTDAACSPCHFYGRRSCPKLHLNCLNDIKADAVWDAIEKLNQ